MVITLLLLATSFAYSTDTSDWSELFNISHNPTVGELSLRKGDQTETIVFGKSTGFYALGIRLPAALMPEPYRTRFSGTEAIEVMLGNTAPAGKVQSFGTLLLFSSQSPQQELKAPSRSEPGIKKAFFIQIQSPKTSQPISDNDRLRGTYFAAEGSAKISQKEKPTMTPIRFSDRQLNFSKSRIRVELNTQLSTPFSPQPASLKGALELTAFGPAEGATRALLSELLAETLRSPIVAPPPTVRSVTGK